MPEDEAAPAPKDSAFLGAAIAASLLVHAMAAWLTVFGLPRLPREPAHEDAINVSLVPPPKPAKKPAIALQPGSPGPKAQKAQSVKPPVPPTPQKQASRPGNKAFPRPPIAAVAPVHRFGPQDRGPEHAKEPGAATEIAGQPEGMGQEAARPDPAANTGPTRPAKPRGPASAALPGEKVADVRSPVAPPPSSKAASETAAARVREPPLHEAEKLYSASATGSAEAATAMKNIPRDIRAGELCVTELRDQLLNADPPYLPDLLPQVRLKEGTVIDIRENAFRSFGRWFALSYRCEIDPEATKVLSFAYRVGEQIPRSQWAKRGLPDR